MSPPNVELATPDELAGDGPFATVRLDVVTKNPLNGSQGMTRRGRMMRAQERRLLRGLASRQMLLQLAQREVPQLPWRVLLVRVAPRRLDKHDGLRAALKPIVDGIADRLGIRDNDPRVDWDYDQRKGRVREYAVEIRLEARR